MWCFKESDLRAGMYVCTGINCVAAGAVYTYDPDVNIDGRVQFFNNTALDSGGENTHGIRLCFGKYPGGSH